MKILIALSTLLLSACATTQYKGHPECAPSPSLCWHDFRDPVTDKFCTTKSVDRVDEHEIRMEFFCQ